MPEARRLPATQQLAHDRFFGLVACIAILAGVFLRLWKLQSVPGFNGDESWTAVQAVSLLSGKSFAWHTPNGNGNLLFLPFELVLHRLFPPSVTLLRIPAAFYGICALAVNFWLCRRLFGTRLALTSTALLSLMPSHIVYSRMGWDCTAGLLFSPIVTFFCIELLQVKRRARSLLGLVVALSGALLAHQTYVMLGFTALICFCWAFYDEIRRHARILFPVLGVLCVAFAGYLLWRKPARPGLMVAHLFNPDTLPSLALLLIRFFSGTTEYQYISGSFGTFSASKRFLYDAAGVLLPALAILGCVLSAWRKKQTWVLPLMGGLVAGILFTYAYSALLPFYPGFERYLLWTVTPTAWLVAQGFLYWFDPSSRRFLEPVALLGLSFVMIAVFYSNYFVFLKLSGGRAALTFRIVNGADPKEVAFTRIVSERSPGESICIYAGEWWAYSPLYYFSLGQSQVYVRGWKPFSLHYDDSAPPSCRRNWFVAFKETPEYGEMIRMLAKHTISYRRIEIPGQDSAGLLELCEVSTGVASQNMIAVLDGLRGEP